MEDQNSRDTINIIPLFASIRELAKGKLGKMLVPLSVFAALSTPIERAAADHTESNDPTAEVFSICSSYEDDAVAGQGVNITNNSLAYQLHYKATLPNGEGEGYLDPDTGTQFIKFTELQSQPEKEISVELTWEGHDDGEDHTEVVSLTTPAIDCPRPSDESFGIAGEKYYSPEDDGTGGVPHPMESVYSLAGPARYETAVAVSQDHFPDGTNTVVIATGQNFPDALAGAPPAVSEDAPILLSGKDSLHNATATEIGRLGATHAILLGGEAALSGQVEEDLHAIGLTTERLAGDDRVATALAIAERVLDNSIDNNSPNKMFLVGGADFYDALMAGPYAASIDAPVLITNNQHLSNQVAEFLQDHSSTIDEIITIDSEFTLADEVEVAAAQAATADLTQIGTGDRFTTSAAVSEHRQNALNEFQVAAGQSMSNVETVYVATGMGYADALTVGPSAASENSALLLVDGQSTTSEDYDFVREYFVNNKTAAMNTLVFLGGEAAITGSNKGLIGIYADGAYDNSPRSTTSSEPSETPSEYPTATETTSEN